jgi:acyl carrier protein
MSDVQEKNNATYKQIFIDILGVSADDLDDTFTFESVDEWDSLAHMDLIEALEAAFWVMFEPEDILHYESYENGKRLLSKYGVEI